MALQDFQTALGLLLSTPTASARKNSELDLLQTLDLSCEERASLDRLLPSPGFRFTAAIQRSWCEGRAANGAALTLSILSLRQRRQIVTEWVTIGGGRSSFFASEADSFLDFIASRLPEPSHELTVARLEQAVHRASDAAAGFTAPDTFVLGDNDIELCRSQGAALVYFFAEPQRIFTALDRAEPLPPFSDRPYPVLFAPGLPGLYRPATIDETALWERLAAPVALRDLRDDKRTAAIVQDFVAIGAAKKVCDF